MIRKLFYLGLFVLSAFATVHYIEPETFSKVFFPFGELSNLWGYPVVLTMAAAVAEGGLYNDKPGQRGIISRNTPDFYDQGGLVSFGRLLFGFAAMLVANGEGLALVGPDGVIDKLDVGAGNAGLKLTTKSINAWIRFAIINPGTNNAALGVSLSGTGTEADPYVIIVSAATNGSAAITSTATQVKGALDANEDIAGILQTDLAGTGLSVVVAFAEAALVKDGSALRFDGVVSHSYSAGDIANEAYNDQQLCTLIRKGIVWVPCEEAITPMDAVRVRIVTEGNNLSGQFRKTAIAGKTAVVNGVRFYGQYDAGNVELELVSGAYTLTLDN